MRIIVLTNRRELLRFSLLLASLLLVGGCHYDMPLSPADGTTIRFAAQSASSSRAIESTQTGPNAYLTMGVFASTHSGDFAPSSSSSYMANQLVERADGASPFAYSPVRHWPSTDRLSFFAYAPHGTAALSSLTSATPEGIPSFAFAVHSESKSQVDLLLALPQYNRTSDGGVVLFPLHHALTKIVFSGRLRSASAGDVRIVVREIALDGLYGSGSRLMDASRSWTLSGAADHRYALTNDPEGGLSNLSLTTLYQGLTTASGSLLLMPQSFGGNDNAKLTISYLIVANDEIAAAKSFDIQLNRFIDQWRSGEAYNLLFTIDDQGNAQSVVAVPVDWDRVEVEADVHNRILNLTRIETGVFDSSVSRIYFWSNQPRDSVYVHALGALDAAGYPSGESFVVNSKFDNLSGSSSPRLHYQGYDGVDPKSGEGYIEIGNANVATDPKESAFYHVYLHAGGLRRSIRIHRQIQAAPFDRTLTTPYVGTFHRHLQKGERIVTWWAGVDRWTAFVDPVDDHAEVLIDRYSSPAVDAGLLYTDSPGDAENYPVSDLPLVSINGSNHRCVSGSGKIYFRVGWRSLSPGTIRYARITVRRGENDPQGAIIQRLYLRQGETEDYLMRPSGDPYYSAGSIIGQIFYPESGASSIDQRPYARKLVPYNLTDPNRWSGGSNNADHSALPVRGGSFTDYPSQCGSFFRWRINRVAYHPTNPSVAIAGWLSVNTDDIDWDPMTNETCPEGYRRFSEAHGENYRNDNLNINVVNNYDYRRSEFAQSLYIQPVANKLVNDGNIIDRAGLLNSYQGFLADGFFDRRAITKFGNGNQSTSVGGGLDIAYYGSLYYNERSSASIFFPHSGLRDRDGSLRYVGVSAIYWSSSRQDVRTAWILDFLDFSSFPRFAVSSQGEFPYGATVRCVRSSPAIVTLHPNGGSGTQSPANPLGGDVPVYTVISLPPCTFTPPSGKTFDRWSAKPSGSGADYWPGDSFTLGHDYILYAVWK